MKWQFSMAKEFPVLLSAYDHLWWLHYGICCLEQKQHFEIMCIQQKSPTVVPLRVLAKSL